MSFKLKNTEYQFIDFLRIPFQCDAPAAIGLSIQKFLTGFSSVIQIPITAKFIDTVLLSYQGEVSVHGAVPWFLLLLLCVGWRRVSYVVGRMFSSRLEVHGAAAMSMAFTEKRSGLHYSHFEDRETCNLINRVCRNSDRHASLMLQRTCNLLLYMIRIIGILYLVFTQVWWIGALTLILCILLFLVSLKSGTKSYETLSGAAESERSHQYLGEVLAGREAAEERALFGFSQRISRDWYEQYEQSRKIKLKANIKLNAGIRAGSMIMMLLSSFIIVMLIFPAAHGEITMGMFLALCTSMYDLVNMVGTELTKVISQLSQYKSYLKDLTSFSQLEETKGAEDCPDKNRMEFSSLEFKNVSFCYPGTSVKILKNINIKINKGIHYAFVGMNGAGKTTVIKLITGLYDNYDGEILLNGKSLKSYTQGQMKSMFCGLYQDFAKYNITVKENVCIGNINAMYEPKTMEQAVSILKMTGLYQEMSALPKGLDTQLGKIWESGADISGGQWQKLAIARTLMNPAPVLILDEPTASLDPISESRLYGQFEEISRGRTSIFISHRLGSIKLADKIFVLKDGEVAEEGSHKELQELSGIYAHMYESQRSWYK